MKYRNIQPLGKINWEEFENLQNSLVLNRKNTGYDEEPVFKQGIAIVKKYGKYGAVMVGGKEIVPPIYDALSDFNEGLATAEYSGVNRIVNLSGQVQVKKIVKTYLCQRNMIGHMIMSMIFVLL